MARPAVATGATSVTDVSGTPGGDTAGDRARQTPVSLTSVTAGDRARQTPADGRLCGAPANAGAGDFGGVRASAGCGTVLAPPAAATGRRGVTPCAPCCVAKVAAAAPAWAGAWSVGRSIGLSNLSSEDPCSLRLAPMLWYTGSSKPLPPCRARRRVSYRRLWLWLCLCCRRRHRRRHRCRRRRRRRRRRHRWRVRPHAASP